MYFQAPRAKMNQQRSRRFRASKEGVELVEEKEKIREEVIQRGERRPLVKQRKISFRVKTFLLMSSLMVEAI